MEVFLSTEKFMLFVSVLAVLLIVCGLRLLNVYTKESGLCPKWEKLTYWFVSINIVVAFTSSLFSTITFTKPIDLSNYHIKTDALDRKTGKIYTISVDDTNRLENCIYTQAYLTERYDTVNIFFIKFHGLSKEGITVNCM